MTILRAFKATKPCVTLKILLGVCPAVTAERAAILDVVGGDDLRHNHCWQREENRQRPRHDDDHEDHFRARLELLQRVDDASVAVGGEGDERENRHSDRNVFCEFAATTKQVAELAIPRPRVADVDESGERNAN